MQLDRLNVLGSLMMIAAHPDDENTALLAYFARGRKVRTAYLSCTRGEGGQNIIGSEQGDLLGVIRTQELLAARRIDGAEQFFTRAIDFGFTKTAAETLAKWGRERILEDLVRAIRYFQPDVLVLRFSGTPRDGHGQHQTSAILGKEAFSTAADPQRFPDAGPPWQSKRLLFNTFAFSREQEQQAAAVPGRLEIDAGEYNPLLGKSYSEIAAISRSQHRSQAMGSAERRGPMKNYLTLVAGEAAVSDPFDGVDTTWSRVPGGAAVGAILAEAARTFSPTDPASTIPLLLKARPLMRRLDHPWALLKLRELDEAIALCAGLWLEASADRYLAVPGSGLKLTLTAVNRSRFPLTWKEGGVLAYNQVLTRIVTWPVADSYSQPFWLARPKQGDAYDVDPAVVFRAEAPPWDTSFEIEAGEEILRVNRPILYRWVDPAEGEKTRPVVVAPPVVVNLAESVFVFPNGQAQPVQVQVKANVSKQSGEVRLEIGGGWKVSPPRAPFRLPEAGERAELRFEVKPPSGGSNARMRAIATVEGKEIASGMQAISYPHIPPQVLFPPAEARLESFDVKTLARRVGYIAGAGDEIPRALRQIGCEVTLLDDLARRNLNEFDAIIAGVRAYNVRPELRAHQQRLLDYVRDGGTYIVQYNTAEGGPFGQRDTGALARLGPYPLKIGRDRVTVEEAPVTLSNPGHALLRRPNLITPADFDGWVQERGLYFASEWDPRYESVFESHDPGEKPLPGGLLYARHGKGVYLFTAYSWFRQLPAGVPGAYRIFANLLSAGKAAP
ncbi:MAG: PIG-L family deacetylase [Candidatus Solibacter usitatus]|nr:PIG-L family deacetylase [Candidatus Solibacter usitatus]